MPASSLALVIIAGLIHAIWNITAKKACNLSNRKRTRARCYRPVQGMIGTAEIAFIGEPSSTRLLIAT